MFFGRSRFPWLALRNNENRGQVLKSKFFYVLMVSVF